MIRNSQTRHLAPLGIAIATIPSLSLAVEKEVPLVNDWLHHRYPESQSWDVGAEIRGRYESKEDAGVVPNTDFISGTAVSQEATLMREKIHVGYHGSPWFDAYLEGRDASTNHSPFGDDAFDLFQAYVTVGNPKEFPLTARLGRQELSYGDQRFVGKADWNNFGRSFDAIKLRLEGTAAWVEAFGGRVALPDDRNFNVSNDYDTLSGIYGSTPCLMPWQETQIYFLARNTGPQAANAIAPGIPGTPSVQRDVYTIGTLWKSSPEVFGNWDYSLEAALQFGSVFNTTAGGRLDLRSYGIFLDAGYTWKESFGAPRLGVSYDHGAGDDDPNDGTVNTFENYYGTQHKPYGLMDLAGPRNMHVPKITFSIKPAKGLTLGIDCLALILADTDDYFYPEIGGGRNGNGYGINPGATQHVGTEIDLYANYNITPWSNFQLGYGHFFTGGYISDSVGPASTDADWFYSQLTLTF